MTVNEIEATTKAVERGNLIFRYDQAAWHTTDTLVAEVKATELNTVRGWVVTPIANSLLVTYYRLDGGEPKAVYSAAYDGRSVTERHSFENDGDRTLPQSSVRLIRAQQQARAMVPGLVAKRQMFACSKARFNEVVLPPIAAGDPITVYFLTPQTENAVIPLGGHYRFEVRDAQPPTWRAFSKSCLNMPKPANGASAEALVVTHLLDPQPNEIHVFETLATRMPLIVAVVPQRSIWGVTGNGITLEQRRLEAPK